MSEIGRMLEEERRRQQLASGIALMSLITDLILYRPPKREHWWQFWRERADG